MLVAVTGGMGFIGQEVVSQLQSLGHRVVIVDYWADLISSYEKERFPILESVYRTLSASESCRSPWEFLDWLDGNSVDVVIHLGAVADTLDLGSYSLYHENVEFTEKLVRKLNLGKSSEYVPGIVFASSAAVYGSKGFPNNPYGLTKSLGEKLVSGTRGDFVSLRLFNVFGKNEHHKNGMSSVPFKIFQAYTSGGRFQMHSLDAARDFVPVATVATKIVGYAEFFFKRSESPETATKHREVVDLGTGYATTFSDIDLFVMQATGNHMSCVNSIDVPPDLIGRYQRYTCAGQLLRANAGHGSQSTRDAIEELYGR